MPSYAVSGASLTGNVAAITLTSVGGLETGYTIEVAGVGSPFDGTYSLASVTSSTGIITYAAIAMLRSAWQESRAATAAPTPG